MAKRNNITRVKRVARRVEDLGKIPLEATLDDVIAVSDISDVLAEIQKKRADIEALLTIWVNPNGTVSYRYAKCSGYTIIGLCDIVKQHCIQQGWLNP